MRTVRPRLRILDGATRYNTTDAPEVAALEAQIADLKKLVALLRSQLADIRDQKDKWQSS